MKISSVPLELLLKHPTFTSRKEENSVFYSGIIIVNADRYTLEVEETITREGVEFNIVEKNCSLPKLKGQLNIWKNIQMSNVTMFIDNIEKVFQECSAFPKDRSSLYRKILHEYTEFTKFFIDLKSCSLSSDLSSIRATSCDEKGREHTVELGIDFNESKDLFHFKEHDMPTDKTNTLNKKSSSLLEIYNIFLGYIERLQLYFDLMDLIDERSKVLESHTQSRKCNFRRIWLGENVCVIITFDPFNIQGCPNIAFLGPDRLVNEFRTKLNENLEKWDSDGNIFQEILNLLGIQEFPGEQHKPPGTNQKIELLKEDNDCSICFCSNLDGKLPEIVCNNRCCENFFHKYCLYEWLISINSKKIFNEIQGPCPNCEKMITCNIPDR